MGSVVDISPVVRSVTVDGGIDCVDVTKVVVDDSGNILLVISEVGIVVCSVVNISPVVGSVGLLVVTGWVEIIVDVSVDVVEDIANVDAVEGSVTTVEGVDREVEATDDGVVEDGVSGTVTVLETALEVVVPDNLKVDSA